MRKEAVSRIRLVFDLLDTNGDGHVESGDFELMADRVVQASPDISDAAGETLRSTFHGFWRALVTELDSDGDGRVSFDEYAVCVLSPDRFHAPISAFAAALAGLGDRDQDGLVTRPDFVALMRAIGFEEGRINALFDDLQPTASDRIPAATWVEAVIDFYSPTRSGVAGDRLVGDSAAP
ncbi:EF-hand domain-containing protein [Actinoalloteichus caeruleus]|uniref:EF-hand domain pair n=1 Tax=Actinoalloteichus caeruleus DSM 43889 TaxID=1120930 RepID=A0ABT1JDR2_ACTCY|nr:EF-hand domain-containing protein [Actinoalloteichus caeruleus]MCP2330635.1 EF-hand domain pair [Actinoalloteichus caeruleus DSM 43889]